MYQVTSPVLGVPQIVVQQTQADWKKFLGRDSSSPAVNLMRPGFRIEAWDAEYGVATFMLAYGVAGLQIGDAVVIGADYATTRSVAASRGIVGISMFANTDTAALSWFAIQGPVPCRAATMAVNLPLYLTATAGSLSSTVVANQQVTGAHSILAAGGTVDTKACAVTNTSDLVSVPDLEGLYVGMAVTGTGIPAATTISAIGYGGLMLGSAGPLKNQIQLSAAATATGFPTLTFAHPTTFGTAALAHPVAAGLG